MPANVLCCQPGALHPGLYPHPAAHTLAALCRREDIRLYISEIHISASAVFTLCRQIARAKDARPLTSEPFYKILTLLLKQTDTHLVTLMLFHMLAGQKG